MWKRKQKEEFLESKLTGIEKEQYKKLEKIINILIVIDIPLIILAVSYNYFIWIPPFIAMFLSTVRQVYRRIKLQKYGFENYNKWYLILFYIIKWIFIVLFFAVLHNSLVFY